MKKILLRTWVLLPLVIFAVIALCFIACEDVNKPCTHVWGEWMVTTAPTCVATGMGISVCTLCGETDPNTIIPIDINNHNLIIKTATATCTEGGDVTWKCDRTGCSYENEEIGRPALGHKWNWQETIAQTYIEAGEEKGICVYNQTHVETREKPILLITKTKCWDTARSQLNGRTGSYTLTVNGNVGINGINTTDYSFGSTPNASLIVTLKGNGKLYLINQGHIVNIGANQTLIIDSENLILEGLTNGKNGATQDNNKSSINVNGKLVIKNGIVSGNTKYTNTNSDGGGGIHITNGNFEMSGGEIIDNSIRFTETLDIRGGGIYITNGNFEMSGGKISNNNVYSGYSGEGGGVYVDVEGIFTMTDGEISNNFARGNGGGVVINGYYSTASFTMFNGIISDNRNGSDLGGGVYIKENSTFTMNGGKILKNSNNWAGGGLYLSQSTSVFIMNGGEISGNHSNYSGGGICSTGKIYITNGIIYGSNEIESLRNTGGSGATLSHNNNGTPVTQYGTFSGLGGEWISNGDLFQTDDTINVINGVLQ